MSKNDIALSIILWISFIYYYSSVILFYSTFTLQFECYSETRHVESQFCSAGRQRRHRDASYQTKLYLCNPALLLSSVLYMIKRIWFNKCKMPKFRDIP